MGSSVTSTTPLRKRKGYRPRAKIYSILDGLTDRDVQICLALWEFRVLTTHQIFEFFFSTPARARKRLVELFRRGIIARFRPPTRPGSHPQHYVLDELGARIVAGYKGIEFKELGYRKERVLGWAKSQRLQHLRDANDFFSSLSWACRSSRDHDLIVVEGEVTAGRRTYFDHQRLRPDGFGVLQGPDGYAAMFLEMDRGTEPTSELQWKLRRYDLVGSSKDPAWGLLFCVRSQRREANLQQALHPVDGLVVATATLQEHMRAPLGANWLPVRESHRFGLMDLPHRGAPGRSADDYHHNDWGEETERIDRRRRDD